ncbi:MAG: hypothetical protein AAGU27_21535, partial [Dehalobacterium sp.]
HRIMEHYLDEIVFGEIGKLLNSATLKLEDIDKSVEDRLSRQKDFEKQCEQLRIRIHKKEEEIKGYSRQLAQEFISEKIFLELVNEANRELEQSEKKLTEITELSEANIDNKEEIIKSINVLKDIIKKKDLTNTTVSILIDKILIKEMDEGGQGNRPKLDIEIIWNTSFIYEETNED